MFYRILKIKNPRGIHLKPSSELVKLSLSHPQLKLKLEKDGVIADMNSVMSILGLELTPGSQVKIKFAQENHEVLQQIEDLLS